MLFRLHNIPYAWTSAPSTLNSGGGVYFPSMDQIHLPFLARYYLQLDPTTTAIHRYTLRPVRGRFTLAEYIWFLKW